MRRAHLALLLVAGCVRSADAPPDAGDDRAAALQAALDRARQEQRALGAGAAVRLPGGEVWIGASGLAAPDGPALTIDDRYPIGSITKVFTAVVVLQLVEEGALTLDDPVARWLPALPGADAIRVRDLLAHTSGLAEYLADPAADVTQPVAREALLAYATARGLAFEPGSAWAYSNTNYAALGLVIEDVTGASYAGEVRARILDPLGLGDTFVDGDEEIPGGFVLGYALEDDRYVAYPREHPSWAWAAGAIVSSLPDQLRFFDALATGELVAPATLATMLDGVPIPGAPPGTVYGLGLETSSTPWGPLHGHGGLIHLLMAASGTLPDRDVTAAAFASTVQADPFAILFAVVDAAE